MKHLVDKYMFTLHIFPLMKWKLAKQMYFQKGKANNSAVTNVFFVRLHLLGKTDS